MRRRPRSNGAESSRLPSARCPGPSKVAQQVNSNGKGSATLTPFPRVNRAEPCANGDGQRPCSSEVNMRIVFELAPVIGTIISAHCPGTGAGEEFMRECVH